jgi:hypothetical protein
VGECPAVTIALPLGVAGLAEAVEVLLFGISIGDLFAIFVKKA